MLKPVVAIFTLLILSGCESDQQSSETSANLPNKATSANKSYISEPFGQRQYGSDSYFGYEEERKPDLPWKTWLIYDHFSVIIHQFDAFTTNLNYTVTEYIDGEEIKYYSDPSPWIPHDEEEQHRLRNAEGKFCWIDIEEEYSELALIVFKDTLHLFESFGNERIPDSRINNTLFQIIPKNTEDVFKVSYCYQTELSQRFDDRNLSYEEEIKLWESFEKIREIYAEQTAYIPLKDSAQYYFRALSHQADMVQVKIVDGAIVPMDMNTQEQLDEEEKLFEEELSRIKRKYNLIDSLEYFPGEYGAYTTLARGNKLFSYTYPNYLFRIERFHGNKKVETKYISVEILYGC
jgi:hypothetical protein